ncbi:MAG TPA: hypothetical protein VJM33_10035 [Microthrixaceae bacterium]|nr:hypothetical protein [Microthrixaceae bacterium]
MKIAVSIPDPLFEAVEQVARSRKIPRSQLYARALELLLAAEDDRSVTDRLDVVHGEQAFTIDPALADAQARALAEDW